MAHSAFSFLSLPEKVRLRVYTYAHATRPCPIDLNAESLRQKKAEKLGWRKKGFNYYTCRYRERLLGNPDITNPEQIGCLCRPLPHRLLLTCHTIHDELEPIIYGSNVFIISPSAATSPDHLHILHSLSSRAWASFKSIHLNLTAGEKLNHAGDGADDGAVLPGKGMGLETRELGPGKAAAQDLDRRTEHHPVTILREDCSVATEILASFGALCDSMRTELSFSQLALSIGCNTDEYDTAIFLVQHLAELPPMRSCAIHFGYRDDPALCDLAKEKAVEACVKTPVRKATPSFLDLPKELRLWILSYTDLVFRWKRYQDEDGLSFYGGRAYYASYRCCTKCTDALAVCCCPKRAAAYSQTCDCYRVPLALFLVNHHFYDDATEVFFSQTRFIFGDNLDKEREWIQNLPARACSWLRTFDVRFLNDDVEAMAEQGTQNHHLWNDFVKAVKDRLEVSKLWISINAGDMYEDFMREEVYVVEENEDVETHFRWLRKGYKDIMQPLKQHLRGLRKLHVFLSWFPEYETIAEKEVVGPEYDSSSEGKRPFDRRSDMNPHLNTGVRLPKFD